MQCLKSTTSALIVSVSLFRLPAGAAPRHALADRCIGFIERPLDVDVAVVAINLVAPNGPAIAGPAREQFEIGARIETPDSPVSLVGLCAVLARGRHDHRMHTFIEAE